MSRFSTLRLIYLIVYSLLGYTLFFINLHTLSLNHWQEMLILGALISFSFYYTLPLPRYRTTISISFPFYILGILILKIQFIYLFSVLIALWQLSLKAGKKNLSTYLVYLWNPVRMIPVFILGYYFYNKLGGGNFSQFSKIPWVPLLALILTLSSLDWITINAYEALAEGKPPWKKALPLLQMMDVPFSPLILPLYLVYETSGSVSFFIFSFPYLAGIWLTTQFFVQSLKKQEYLERLNIANDLIHSSLNLQEMLQRILERVKEIFDGDGAELYFAENGIFQLKCQIGKSPWNNKKLSLDFSKQLQEFNKNKPFLNSDDPLSSAFSPYIQEGIHSILILPLVSEKQVSGYLFCLKTVPHFFFEDHLDTANVIMGQISNALFGARVHEELKKTLEELENTKDQLIQTEKMAGIGKLAAGVAHEINNPLGAIVLNAERAVKNQLDSDSIETILDAARTCKRIVEGLLRFSRQAKSQKIVFSLKEVIENNLEFWENQFELENIQIKTELSGDLEVSGKQEEMAQVLLNLLMNAKEAILEAKREKGEIRIKGYEKEEKVFLEIEDNGCGIPEKNLSKIFDPFFTTREIGKGTGLGLSISYGIVSGMEGKIEVKSQVGAGTVFVLIFPLGKQIDKETNLITKALQSF
jgi:signal transduction histidine kinase